MSTKITRGKRLHLIRVMERLEFPMLTYWGPPIFMPVAKRAELLRLLADARMAFVVPPGLEHTIVEARPFTLPPR